MRCSSYHVFMKRTPIEARIWSKVTKSARCWNWNGSKSPFGHGYIRLPGRKGKLVMVHRIIFELYRGEIPKGMSVLHRCDNPACVNPEHLWIGTKSENTYDMIVKGRYKGGHGRALNHAQVLEIRRLHSNGFSVSQLSKMFSICKRQIWKIHTGRSWKSILNKRVAPSTSTAATHDQQ